MWSAIAAGGGAFGLLLGGVLTDLLSWEWIFFVNVPIGIATAVLAIRYVPESRAPHRTGGIDLPGAITVTAGLVVLVYAIVKAEDFGWGSARTLGLAAIAFALLAAFVFIERTSKAPLIRLGIFRVRSLAGANTVLLLVVGGLFAFFFFSSLYVQQILGYSPLEAGLAFLPVTVGIGIGAAIAQQLVKRIGVRTTGALGMLIAAFGLYLFSRRLRRRHLPQRRAARRDPAVDRHGPVLRADHADRDDERRRRGRRARVGPVQHGPAGRRRARARRALDAGGRQVRRACSPTSAAAPNELEQRERAARRLPGRVHGRRDPRRVRRACC